MYYDAVDAGYTEYAIQDYMNKTKIYIDPSMASVVREFQRLFEGMYPIMETLVNNVDKIIKEETVAKV
jgi:hypothetical protein